MSAYKSVIRAIVDGMPVNAASANMSAEDLSSNVDYLYERLVALQTGQALFAYGVPVEAGALVGMPVYYNPLTQQYERAIAQAVNDPTTGAMIPGPSSQSWGLVFAKSSGTIADLLLAGYAALDLTNSAGVKGDAALYYLSGMTPGGLLKQRPPVSVPVLRCDGQGNVLLTPNYRDLLTDHKHYKFPMRCFPAGHVTPPTPGEPHVITSPDPTFEGWLPANHAVFNGKAPAVAAFGYNIGVSAFAKLWPPLPLDGVYIDFDRGEDPKQGAHGVPLGSQGLIYINRDGIWWTSNCYGDVPWPTTLSTSQIASSLLADSDYLECPRDLQMRMNLYFTQPIFQNSDTVVTSLTSKSPLLTIVCQGTNAAAETGPLALDLNLNFLTNEVNQPGYQVLKTQTGDAFQSGPVTEGIYTTTPGTVTLSGDASRNVNLSDPTSPLAYQGLVNVAVNANVGGSELPIELIRLSGTTEEFYQGVTELGMSAGKASSFRGRIYVPVQNVAPGTLCRFRFAILGRAAGTIPALPLTYRRIPRAAVGSSPLALPTVDSSLVFTTGVGVTVDQYVEFESAKFTVNPGDLVFFTLSRNVSDGYSGQLLFLHMLGILG